MPLEIPWPASRGGMYVSHNEHKDYHQSVAEWAEDDPGGSRFQWENDEAKQRAIETGEAWTMQWYPETPIGFYAVAAPTFEELIAWVAKFQIA